MVALGELPPIDVAIHADTTHERQDTYAFAAKYTPWLESRGVRVVTIYNPNPDVWNGFRVAIPAFTFSGKLRLPKNAQFGRQCTGEWKIAPIRRWLQTHRNGEPVELWIGISLDEALRMKSSDVKYITHRWPLIEKRMTRGACIQWLQAHKLEMPPKSACVFCPFHDSRSWQEMKSHGGADWQEAVTVDNAIRKARPPYDLFVHPSRRPLESLDLRTDAERGQLSFESWDEECTGLCGV